MSRLQSVVMLTVFASAFLIIERIAYADPNVDASKTDALTNDVDGDGVADSGDAITYTVIITNNGDMDATDVSYSDTIDANSTLVPGSVETTPLAVDDDYAATGNVQIAVGAPGVLANDNDPDGGSLSAVVISGGSSTNGGDVNLLADGSFSYNPPPGFEGLDTFTYTAQDSNSNTNSGTVSIAVTDMIWFVDAGATCPCDGRLTNPFTDVAVTADSFDLNAADAAGDNIFIADGAYNGGLTLLNSQKLIGDGSSTDLAAVAGITLAPDSTSLPVFSGTDPQLASTGDNLTVGANNTIRGVSLSASGSVSIRGSSVGTLTVAETSISGSGGIDVNTGDLAVSLDALSSSSSTDSGIALSSVTGAFSIADTGGTVAVNNFAAIDITGTGGGVLVSATFASVSSTNSATRGVRLANLTAGSSVDCGATTITASTVDGVVLSNNAGSAFTFADLDIDNFSTNQRGIFASTSGTLNISDGDIDGGSGRGVDIDGTDLNVTLASITSVGGSTAGIDLNTTTGTFEVTGDGVNTSVGGNATGGTISGKTGSDGTNNGIGVLLDNATNVTLRRMQLNDFDNFAVRGNTVTGFALNNCTVSGTNGTSAVADEGSISFTNLLGSADILDSVISGGLEDNVRVDNSSGTLNRLTVDNSTLNENSTALGNDCILVIASSSATVNVSVTNSTLTSARGDLIQTAASGSASMDVVITDNVLTNAHTNIVSGGGGTTISGGDNTTVTYDVSRNTMEDALGTSLVVHMGVGGSATWSGTIDNNNIGDATDAGSGSEQAHGINIEAQGAGTHTTAITNNTIVEIGDRGIALFAIDGSARLNATVSDNTISQPFGSFPQEAIYAQGGAVSTDTNVICADIFSNSFVGASGAFNDDFRLRQRKQSTFRLPGYAGTQGDTAAVVAFVQANNTGSPTGSATVDWPGSGGGFVGTSCASPLLAARGQGSASDATELSVAELDLVINEAVRAWLATDLTNAQLALLAQVSFDIVELPDGRLGEANGTSVLIDSDGAGYGWFADTTPQRHEEFVATAYKTKLFGRTSLASADRMDLLSVVMHEIGHVIGYEHDTGGRAVMAETLDTGVRRLPALVTTKSRSVAGETPTDAAATPVTGGIASGETVNLAIGTLPAGESIAIEMQVTVDSPLPIGTLELCNQGIVSGNNFADELTDDPDTGGVADPTCTALPEEGACCDLFGVCTLRTGDDCTGDDLTFQGEGVDCTPGLCPRIIPTVSEWGIAIMALIGLIVGWALFGRGRKLAD